MPAHPLSTKFGSTLQYLGGVYDVAADLVADIAAAKTKLAGIASGATALNLSSTLPAALGTAAIGVGNTAARSDHVHENSAPVPYVETFTGAAHADNDDFNTLNTTKWRFLAGSIFAANTQMTIDNPGSGIIVLTPVFTSPLPEFVWVPGPPRTSVTVHWENVRRPGWVRMVAGYAGNGSCVMETLLTNFGTNGCVWIRMTPTWRAQGKVGRQETFGIALAASTGGAIPDVNNFMNIGYDQSQRMVAGQKIGGSAGGAVVDNTPHLIGYPTLWGFQKTGNNWKTWIGWDDGQSVLCAECNTATVFNRLVIYWGPGIGSFSKLVRTNSDRDLPW